MKVEVNDYPLHYESYGAGRPLFLFPGWTMSAHVLAYFHEPVFAERQGWQRIYIDPPGHGRSPGIEHINNLDDMLEIILDAVDQLSSGRKFSLFGLSLGAYLARGIIHRRPQAVNGLMMSVPIIISEDQKRDVPPLSIIYEEPGIMDALEEDEKEMFTIAVVRTQKFLESMRSSPQPPEGGSGNMDFLTAIRGNPQAYKFSFDVDALPEPFPGPTAIITGRQDVVTGYRDAWKLIEKYPRATFLVADRAGHFLEEKSAMIQAIFHDWLDRTQEYIQAGDE